MERPGVPVLLVLMAVLAVTQAPRLAAPAASRQAEPETPAAETGPAAEPAGGVREAPPAPRERDGWRRPLALLAEHLGLAREAGDEAGAGVGAVDPAAVVAEARRQGYRLESLVALVPDPVDSSLAFNFDQSMESIHKAFAEEGYLLDRLWLPWSQRQAAPAEHRRVPGVLLFRRGPARAPGPEADAALGEGAGGAGSGTDARRRLAVVLLVGETPKQGLHEEAFRQAASFAAHLAHLAREAGEPEASLRVLGPSFSGTAPSLRRALEGWRRTAVAGGQQVRVVSGTATSPAVSAVLDLDDVEFARTVVDDELLQQWCFQFVDQEMGWAMDRVALFSEFDTSYGQTTQQADAPKQTNESAEEAESAARTAQFVRVRFPSGLASIRSAWAGDPARQEGDPLLVRLPRTTLELRLADQSRPVDVVPQYSSLTVAANDLALSNLMRSLWRGGTRYVGILATDVRDKLFLAERIRRFAPDMVLFTFDNHLLYAHPQYGEWLDGTLVFSSFPLATESEGWSAFFPGPAARYRRQFTGEFQQGTYLAVRALLSGEPVDSERDSRWISVVGNGSLWPLATSITGGRTAPLRQIGYRELAGRGDLSILLMMAVLCLLAVWLWSVYPPRRMRRGTDSEDRTARRLLLFGTLVLTALGAVLAVIGLLPLVVGGLLPLLEAASVDTGLTWKDWFFRALFVVLLLGGYLFLVWSGRRATAEPRHFALWALAGLALLPVLGGALHELWMPGGSGLFYLRVRQPTSGLSPFVSLGLAGLGVFCWTLMELKRRRLIARQAIEWPLRWRLEPPLEGAEQIAEPLQARLDHTFPGIGPPSGEGGRRLGEAGWFWLVLAVVLAPPLVMLLRVVQPICETDLYGQLLLLVFAGLLALAAVAFHQFFALWLDLHRLLARLDRARLVKAFRRIQPEVAWSPMRAFGWKLPDFKMLVLSADWLAKVAPGRKHELKDKLEAVFRADLAADLSTETAKRRQLNEIFFEAGRTLAHRAREEEVEEYFALRIVAFLGPVVSHMRNCLAGAMLAALLLLFAVRSYAFQPQWFVSMGVWAALAVGVALTLWVFVQMDRNATMSAIGGTDAGKLSLDRHFYANVLTYGALPIVGIVITQFPQVGRLVAQWLNPLLRIAGTQ